MSSYSGISQRYLTRYVKKLEHVHPLGNVVCFPGLHLFIFYSAAISRHHTNIFRACHTVITRLIRQKILQPEYVHECHHTVSTGSERRTVRINCGSLDQDNRCYESKWRTSNPLPFSSCIVRRPKFNEFLEPSSSNEGEPGGREGSRDKL